MMSMKMLLLVLLLPIILILSFGFITPMFILFNPSTRKLLSKRKFKVKYTVCLSMLRNQMYGLNISLESKIGLYLCFLMVDLMALLLMLSHV